MEFSSQCSQVDLNRDPLPERMFHAHWETLDVMIFRLLPVLKSFDSRIFFSDEHVRMYSFFSVF